MQLKAIKQITGIIRLRSGLHIGAGKDTVEIGGLDQPIIKHPVTGAPYIPGSSLKGKMRALLETSIFMQREQTKAAVMGGKPCNCGKKDCPACKLFGAHNDPKHCDPDLGPTRILVRDANLTQESEEQFKSGRLPMEVKYENIINRIQGVAEHPRPLERVPAGTSFTLTIALKVFDNDVESELLKHVWQGLKLIEMDALGGGGSRGSGQVSFADLQLDGMPVDLHAVAVFEK
mgnify:CR=1 FL=1